MAQFVSRHRATVRDLTLIAAFAALGMTLAYWVDIFPNDGGAGPRLRTIELDEVLLVGGLTLLMGLLLFVSRYSAQKQEMRRRIAAEAEVRKLAFQDALTGLPNRRQYDDALKAALASPPRSPGCQQGQGAWISGPVSATETSLLFENRFPHPPRPAARPQIPPPFLQAVEDGREVAESVGPARVDGTVL